MAPVPTPLHTVPASIYRWWESQAEDGLRQHLGASLIGHPCLAYLWHCFRWSAKAGWEGRMLRLFDRGQREESVLVRELRGIGAEVSECQPTGEQWHVEAHGGHFGGSMDAIVRKLPGGSATNWEVLEFKTHNAKSFKELEEKGVEVSKRQHWCQMQVYMRLTGMTRANYIAVCKDDDRIYHERVHVDRKAGEELIERAGFVIFSEEPPVGISVRPDWWQCKLCQYHGHCHGSEAPLPTCRSCCHVTPEPDGTWSCDYHHKSLTVAEQKAACSDHRYIPLVLANFASMIDADYEKNWAHYYLNVDGEFTNGAPPYGLSSQEIHACRDKSMLVDPYVDELRKNSTPALSVDGMASAGKKAAP